MNRGRGVNEFVERERERRVFRLGWSYFGRFASFVRLSGFVGFFASFFSFFASSVIWNFFRRQRKREKRKIFWGEVISFFVFRYWYFYLKYGSVLGDLGNMGGILLLFLFKIFFDGGWRLSRQICGVGFQYLFDCKFCII